MRFESSRHKIGICLIMAMILSAHCEIIWVTDDSSRDHGYTNHLASLGYDIASVQNERYRALDSTKINELNQADLVIVSRMTSSGSYIEGAEVGQWNSLRTPIMLLNTYLEGNTKWKWVNSSTLVDSTDLIVVADAGDQAWSWLYAEALTTEIDTVSDNVVKLLTATDPGNGVRIAKKKSNDLLWLTRWGSGVEYYDGCAQTSGAERVFYPCTIDFDEMTADGIKIFDAMVADFMGSSVAAYYSFDGDVQDSVGGKNGTAVGTEQYVLGYDNASAGAFNFDGSSYIDIGTDGYPNRTNCLLEGSVSLWVKGEADGVNRTFMGVFNDGNTDAFLLHSKTDSYTDQLRLFNRDHSQNPITCYHTDNSDWGSAAVFNFLTFSWRGVSSNIVGNIYLNGELQSTTQESTDSLNGFVQWSDWEHSLLIGAFNNRGTPAQHFDGAMDDFAVWNRILRDEEVKAIYNLQSQYHYTAIDSGEVLRAWRSGVDLTIGEHEWSYSDSIDASGRTPGDLWSDGDYDYLLFEISDGTGYGMVRPSDKPKGTLVLIY